MLKTLRIQYSCWFPSQVDTLFRFLRITGIRYKDADLSTDYTVNPANFLFVEDHRPEGWELLGGDHSQGPQIHVFLDIEEVGAEIIEEVKRQHKKIANLADFYFEITSSLPDPDGRSQGHQNLKIIKQFIVDVNASILVDSPFSDG